jgi:hypothetical protein
MNGESALGSRILVTICCNAIFREGQILPFRSLLFTQKGLVLGGGVDIPETVSAVECWRRSDHAQSGYSRR